MVLCFVNEGPFCSLLRSHYISIRGRCLQDARDASSIFERDAQANLELNLTLSFGFHHGTSHGWLGELCEY